jgi:broad-specificity NMP kinase
MRVDLSKFQENAWAEMLDTVPYKVLKIARKAITNPNADDEDRDYEALKVMVRDWNVKDAYGNTAKVPRETTQDEFEMINGFILAHLSNHVVKMIKDATPDPNLETASSTS